MNIRRIHLIKLVLRILTQFTQNIIAMCSVGLFNLYKEIIVVLNICIDLHYFLVYSGDANFYKRPGTIKILYIL